MFAVRVVFGRRGFATARVALAEASSSSGVPPKPSVTKFWKKVTVEQQAEDSFVMYLDKRKLRTPFGKVWSAPNAFIGLMAAGEWESAESNMKANSVPVPRHTRGISSLFPGVGCIACNPNSQGQLTSMVARALDEFADDRQQGGRTNVHGRLLKYIHTDSTCYRQEHPPKLLAMQQEHWDPLHSWFHKKFQVPLESTSDIFVVKQPSAVVGVLGDYMSSLSALQLAALERATMHARSLVTGIALVDSVITAERAVKAARVEVDYQTSIWGEVEDGHDVDVEDIRANLAAAALVSRFSS